GLGAPLPSMPATADVPRSAGPGRQPRTSAGPVTPHVQRTPAHADRPTSDPRTGSAPLLGTTDSVNRDAGSPAGNGNSPSFANSPPPPATPLVTPGGHRSTPSVTPEPVTGTGSVQRVPAPETGTASASRAVTSPRPRSGGTTPVVIARAVASSAPLTA